MALRNIRKECKIGLNELAKIVNVSSAYLSELERGIRTNPSKEIMDKIAKALGKTVTEVFYSENTDKKGA